MPTLPAIQEVNRGARNDEGHPNVDTSDNDERESDPVGNREVLDRHVGKTIQNKEDTSLDDTAHQEFQNTTSGGNSGSDLNVGMNGDDKLGTFSRSLCH